MNILHVKSIKLTYTLWLMNLVEDLTNIKTKAMFSPPKKSYWIRKIEGKTKWRDKKPILPGLETDFPP